jgi:hypothetical protein
MLQQDAIRKLSLESQVILPHQAVNTQPCHEQLSSSRFQTFAVFAASAAN